MKASSILALMSNSIFITVNVSTFGQTAVGNHSATTVQVHSNWSDVESSLKTRFYYNVDGWGQTPPVKEFFMIGEEELALLPATAHFFWKGNELAVYELADGLYMIPHPGFVKGEQWQWKVVEQFVAKLCPGVKLNKENLAYQQSLLKG